MQKIDLRNASREELMEIIMYEQDKHFMQQIFEETMIENTVGRLSLIIGILVTAILFMTGGLIWEPGNGIVAGVATAFLLCYMLTKLCIWLIDRARTKNRINIRKNLQKEKPAKTADSDKHM